MGKAGTRIADGVVGAPISSLAKAYVEPCNRTVRYDWLSQALFSFISEAQASATEWLWTYNHERPNMATGGMTPMQKLAIVA